FPFASSRHSWLNCISSQHSSSYHTTTNYSTHTDTHTNRLTHTHTHTHKHHTHTHTHHHTQTHTHTLPHTDSQTHYHTLILMRTSGELMEKNVRVHMCACVFAFVCVCWLM